MRRALLYGFLLSALAGCADTEQEKVRFLCDDGVHLFQSGEYANASQDFEAALKLKPEDAALRYNLGQCYDRQGKEQKAEEQYRACLAVEPNHAPCRRALEALLRSVGRKTECDQMIQDWLAREPKLADAYVEDGWRLRQDGALLDAQGRLQQALSLDSKCTRALVELAILYESMERQDRALALYERALQLNPKQPEVVDRVNLLVSRGVRKPLPD
jgi:tetratricopeptide (TPR) repeat protein